MALSPILWIALQPPRPTCIHGAGWRDIMVAQEIAFVAAAFSAVASIGSVIAAWRVPYAVAKQNEKLREANEARNRKFRILETLLRHRANITTEDSVAALNSIVVDFRSSSKVREAFDRFIDSANAVPFSPQTTTERYLSIINSIIQELGLDSEIKLSAVDRGYYPDALIKARNVAAFELNARHDAYLAASNNKQPPD